MAFDLYITFSGLCLFAPGPDGTLQVLLPEIRGGGGATSHEPIIGSEVIYQPGAPGETDDLWHCRLGRGVVDLTDLKTSDSLKFDLSPASVVDIRRIADAPLKPTAARVQVLLKKGALCTDCDTVYGARWWMVYPFEFPKLMHMATKIHWKVSGITNKVGDGEGLRLSYPPVVGDECKLFTLRPDARKEIRIDIYNTPSDEHPGKPNPAEEEILPLGSAKHFRAYYDLFDKPKRRTVPKFWDKGTGLMLVKVGRRFNCILAAAIEP